ncbi:MAG: hypothetical protein AAFW00_19730 [Bacteroidota bacterium]
MKTPLPPFHKVFNAERRRLQKAKSPFARVWIANQREFCPSYPDFLKIEWPSINAPHFDISPPRMEIIIQWEVDDVSPFPIMIYDSMGWRKAYSVKDGAKLIRVWPFLQNINLN